MAILEEPPERVSFRVDYSGASQKISIDKSGVIVEDAVPLKGVDALRIYYPMLITDGDNDTSIKLGSNTLHMTLSGKSVRLEILEPSEAKLIRTGERLNHRNGIMEPVYCEINGTTAKYRISAE